MHTFNGENGASIIHNGDYSGDAIVRSNGDEITIPCSDLLNFAAEFIRSKRIERLESETIENLLR